MGAEGLAQRNGAQPEADTSRVRARFARPIERMPTGAGCKRCKGILRVVLPLPRERAGGEGSISVLNVFNAQREYASAAAT